jgi:hypothetical protein
MEEDLDEAREGQRILSQRHIRDNSWMRVNATACCLLCFGIALVYLVIAIIIGTT